MEIEVITNNKTKLEIKLPGANHTLCNALKTKLLENDNVKVATYAIRHPLVGVPLFLVETDTKQSALDAVKDAAKKLKADFAKLEKNAAKELK